MIAQLVFRQSFYRIRLRLGRTSAGTGRRGNGCADRFGGALFCVAAQAFDDRWNGWVSAGGLI